MTSSTSSRRRSPSGVTISSTIRVGSPLVAWLPTALLLHLLGLLDDVLDGAHEVEGLLGQVVELAVDDHLEAADGVGEGHVLAGDARELLGHVEGLAEELLDLARARHLDLLVLGELV